MSCDCEQYTCVEAFINPCSEGVELPIEAGYSGNMGGRIWFNGVARTFGMSVTEGENIIIPLAVLNENYTHDMRLYNAGDLIACYKVKTSLDLESGEFPVPPIIENEMQGKAYTGNGTDTQVFTELSGKTLLTISMGGQDFNSDFWTQTGTSVTLDGGMLFIGTVVLNWIN